MKKPKKILFVASYSYPLNAGGGNNAYNFAKYLAEYGFAQTTLLTFNRNLSLPAGSTENNFRVIRIPYFNKNIILKLLSLLFIILPYYAKCIISNNIIYIFGGNIIGYQFLIILSKIFGKKTIFRSSMLGDDDISSIADSKFAPIKFLKKYILALPNYYHSINTAFTASYINELKNPGKIINTVQGVNCLHFTDVSNFEKVQLRKKLAIPENIFVIITVANLILRKGYNEVFVNLKKMKFPFLYIILGKCSVGEDDFAFKKKEEMIQLYQLGKDCLGEKVVFKGVVENVNEYLQASDIFLLNSNKEGVPNALLETMACGCPPVVRTIKGLDKILISGKTAFVFNDSLEMVQKLEESYYNIEKRLDIARETSKFAANSFSFDNVFDTIMDKLESRTDD